MIAVRCPPDVPKIEPLEIETIISNAQAISVANHNEPLLRQTRNYYYECTQFIIGF